MKCDCIMPIPNIFITHGKQTVTAIQGGSLSLMPAHTMGSVVIGALMTASAINHEEISHVIMGQIINTQAGFNPAKEAVLLANAPEQISCVTINQSYSSGLKSIINASQIIQQYNCNAIIAGGQESTNSLDSTQIAAYLKSLNTISNQIKAIHAIADSDIAKYYNHHPTKRPTNNQFTLQIDQYKPYEDTIWQLINKPQDNTKSSANSEKNIAMPADGAAAIMLMNEDTHDRYNIQQSFRIKAYTEIGIGNKDYNNNIAKPIQQCLDMAEWTADELDAVALNELCTAQTVAINKAMHWDVAKVNQYGSAIHYGCAGAASGTISLLNLMQLMSEKKMQKGLIASCLNGEAGIAICIEQTQKP